LLCASPCWAQPGRAGGARWGIDWGDHHCTLARLPEAGAPAVFALWVIPGSPVLRVFVGAVDAAGARPPATRAVLVPGGTTVDLRAMRSEGSELPLPTGQADIAFIGELERATAIMLLRGRETLGQIPLPGARSAVAALRQCTEARLREWGVDPAALAALRAPPRPVEGVSFVNDNDYPLTALSRGAAGRSIIRIAVDAGGRATDCTAVATSGHEDLDRAACRAILARARFHPAIGADGRATAAAAIRAVTWVLPSR
jgi:TonB family protein